MSKKSRKRNKRILAVLGVGAAAAMAAKKKRDGVIADGDANDGAFRKKAKSIPTGPKELGLSTAKKDKKNIPQTTKVNTGSKTKTKVRKPKGYATQTGNSRGDFGETKKPEKKDYFGATLFPKSKAADNFAADNREYKGANQSYEGRKSGGRAGYKSGGSSVKKSMGKALRGGGKVMR